MITYTGQAVFPPDTPGYTTDGIPQIADIAVGLGRQIRFAGQTLHFTTVLCHTLTVAHLVPTEHRIYALLHDAAEAIIGDVPTTWKHNKTSQDEDHLLQLISKDLGLKWPWPDDANAAWKRADLAALQGEAHALEHRAAEKYWPRDEWTDLEQEAFNVTQMMLADALPAKLLHPDNSIPLYRHAITQALGSQAGTSGVIESINEALR